MRAVSACLLIAVAASMAMAQTCPAPPGGFALNMTGYENCFAIKKCNADLCACSGSTSGDFPKCLSTSTLTCSASTTCLTNYMRCLIGITSQRSNTSDTACSTFGSNVYFAVLGATASPSLANTSLLGSCNFALCQLANASSAVQSCTTANASVCAASVLLSTTTTAAPVTTSVVTASPSTNGPDIVVSLRISGGNWSLILADPVAKANAVAALTKDIAGLLGVDAKYIVIVSLTLGSLVVSFQVLSGSGKSPSQLQALVNTATTSTTWLQSTSAVYAKVGTDTLTTLGVTITQTAAPTTLAPGQTNAPASGSALSAAGVAAAALAAVAALLA